MSSSIQSALHDGGPVLFLRETGGRALLRPVVRVNARVVVQADRVAVLPGQGHEFVGPLVILHVRAARDLVNLVVAVVADIRRIAAELIRVEFRAHVAAAAPVFIAHAEVGELPGLLAAVLAAQLRHGGDAVKRHVLDPLAHLLHGAAAHVAGDIRLAAQLAAQLHELMRAEGIVLHNAAPVRVHHALARFLRADAVLPVILVCKAAARPAQHGNADIPQRLHNVGAHPVHVRNGAVFSHEEAVVDAAAQVLRKVAVDVAVDHSSLSGCVDEKICHVRILISVIGKKLSCAAGAEGGNYASFTSKKQQSVSLPVSSRLRLSGWEPPAVRQ